MKKIAGIFLIVCLSYSCRAPDYTTIRNGFQYYKDPYTGNCEVRRYSFEDIKPLTDWTPTDPRECEDNVGISREFYNEEFIPKMKAKKRFFDR